MRRSLFAILPLLIYAVPALAQDPPPGIRLSTTYQTQNRPLLAVRPVEGAGPTGEVLDSITTIVQRDLLNSSRFNVIEGVPQSLRTGAVDYAQWNSLNVVYLVTGTVAPATDGYEISLTVHDVVYARVVHEGRYVLPVAESPAFRMAVHALSDQVVQSALNAPGSAATRIVTTRQHGDGNYDLLIVDSDGYGLRRIAGFGGLIYSPTWSPDGRRILYATGGDRWHLVEREVATGQQRTFDPGGDMIYTPAYAPNGTTIALGIWRENGAEVFQYDISRSGGLRKLTGNLSTVSMYPSYSPDGRRLAFMSDRIGRPAIYVMDEDGGGAAMLSPFIAGQSSDYAAPSWSPTGSRIVFHGVWNRQMRGSYQIMVADADRQGAQIEQITARGNNEDPSWAPDGRNIVYTSVGDGPGGLYIIDAESKNRRLLARGENLRMAEWSPLLLRASDLAARQ
ncbi:MAG: PD40 domain-containing protein [Gemmatimonadetes bacterium]|nr:PD40 domain-containing protein [Gemmatimonadota bacterium]